MDSVNKTIIIIGLLPITIGALVLLGAGFVIATNQVDTALFDQFMVYIVVAWTITLIVFVIVTHTCTSIRPTEAFADGSGSDVGDDTDTQLLNDITTAEKAVCELITRTDKFIQSDVGQPGVDTPALVSDAQQKARDAVDGGIVDCADLSGDAANRITRLEATLKSFTGPELQATYNKSVPCQEGFSDSDSLRARLTAVQATLTSQQQKLLKPIDDKNAALQRGEVSDCDKNRGSKTAVASSNAVS